MGIPTEPRSVVESTGIWTKFHIVSEKGFKVFSIKFELNKQRNTRQN